MIEHYKHFFYLLFINPFELPYRSYDIRQKLVDKPSMISYFPSTSCSTLGHHQGRMYYKIEYLLHVHYYFIRMSVYTNDDPRLDRKYLGNY